MKISLHGFDGDILNMISLPHPYLVKLFRKYDPVKRMMISKDTGKLNPYFTIEKSQLIDLHHFCKK